jgi:outer membrane protein TolC
MPTVAQGGGYTRTNHVQEFGIGSPGQPTRILYPGSSENYGARLALNWPVYSGGRNDALERAAAAERHAAGEDLDGRTRVRICGWRSRARFWAVVTARETERVLARSIESVGRTRSATCERGCNRG